MRTGDSHSASSHCACSTDSGPRSGRLHTVHGQRTRRPIRALTTEYHTDVRTEAIVAADALRRSPKIIRHRAHIGRLTCTFIRTTPADEQAPALPQPRRTNLATEPLQHERADNYRLMLRRRKPRASSVAHSSSGDGRLAPPHCARRAPCPPPGWLQLRQRQAYCSPWRLKVSHHREVLDVQRH
jgi:hypothetical protein